MLPYPIPYSESKSLLLWQRLIRLVSCFLIVLKPVHLLAQLCKRVLHGIRFLSAFLGGAEIGFFSLVLLVPTAMLVFVCGMHAPMLLAEVAMLLCACFLGNLARILGTRPLASFLAPCGKTFCWIVHWIFLGYIHPQQPQETREVKACPWESYLSREGWIDPATGVGTSKECDSLDQPWQKVRSWELY